MPAIPVAPHPPPRQRPFRWAMLGLVWLVYACFGIITMSIPPLVKPIARDLGMTSGQMGMVLGAWPLVYIGTAAIMGTLVDRWGIRRSIGVGVMVIWLSLVLRSVAVDFATLFLIVALFGVGGPIISIGVPKVVSVWFRGRERGLATGIYTTASTSGGILALTTANSLVVPLTGHWRGAFLAYGGVVLVAALLWWLLARDPAPGSLPHTNAPREAIRETPPLAVFRDLVRVRNVQVILALALCLFLLNHSLDSWLPTLLADGGMTAATAGFWAAVPSAVAIPAALIIPGIVPRGRRIPAIALLLLFAVTSTLGLATLSGLPLLGALVVSGLARRPLIPLTTLVLMETPEVGPVRMGAAGGLFYSIAEIGGFGGPLLLGVLRDVSDSLLPGVLLLAAITGSMVLLMPLLKESR